MPIKDVIGIFVALVKNLCIDIYTRIRNEKWKIINSHNFTTIGNDFDFNRVSVGIGTYGKLTVLLHNSDYYLKIGNYCSIAPNVIFVPASEHKTNSFSTYPFKKKIVNSSIYEATSKGNIYIDDDVWIGVGAIILSGVHIEQGSVIAAGSVVVKDVPAYSVVAGNPAKIIKYRFNQDIINKLLSIDFSQINDEFIKKNIESIYTPITSNSDFSYLPHKL